MGYDEERAAIEAKFQTDWADATPIAWDNVKHQYTPDESFVELSIINGVADQISLGNNPLHRHMGIILVKINTPIDNGTGVALTYADTIMAIFRNALTFSGITCRTPRAEKVGEVDGWYRVNAIMPFQRDEVF